MYDPFLSFIDLVKLDDHITELIAQGDQIQGALHKLEQDYITQEHHLENLRIASIKCKKEIDASEAEITFLRDKERLKKISLEKVTNPREYLSLNTQLEEITQKINASEDNILVLLQVCEQTELEFNTNKKQFEYIHATYIATSQHKKEKYSHILKEIEDAMMQRASLQACVQSELLEKYNTMKLKVNNPVVPLLHDSCSACFYKVSLNDIAALKRHKLLQCKDCFRLLYIL